MFKSIVTLVFAMLVAAAVTVFAMEVRYNNSGDITAAIVYVSARPFVSEPVERCMFTCTVIDYDRRFAAAYEGAEAKE